MLGRSTEILEKTVQFKADGSNVQSYHSRILHQLGVNCRWSSIVVDEQPEAKNVSNAGPYLPEDPTVIYAGDRAPDAPGLIPVGTESVKATSLFTLFGPTHHTALIFAAAAGKAQQVLDALGTYPEGTVTTIVIFPQAAQTVKAVKDATLTVVDRDGHAYAGYPPVTKGFSVIVVRPDGVVGAVVQGAAGVARYFDGIFAQV